MRAGQLRQRVEIQQPVDSTDTHGGATRTWSTVATVWGSCEPLKGHELFQAQQMNSQTTHKVTVRYYEGLDPTYRLRVLNADG